TSDAGPNVHNVDALGFAYIPKDFLAPTEDGDLTAFLNDGKKPICIGFGSMPYDASKVDDLLQVAQDLNQRVVLVGKSLSLPDTLEQTPWIQQNVRHADFLPYAWLLPHCSVMVSHGGAGVMHAALRAGCSQVISPLMGDQFAHAKLLEAKGLGAQAGQSMNTMTTSDFESALEKALKCTEAASALGLKIRNERDCGVGKLVQILSNAALRNDVDEIATDPFLLDDLDLASDMGRPVSVALKSRSLSEDAVRPRAASVPKRVSIMGQDDSELPPNDKLLSTSSHHKRGGNQPKDRYTVRPGYAYPKVKMSREEMYKEMNRTSSYFHDLRRSQQHDQSFIGSVHFEALQCFGLPRRDFRKKSFPFCIMVCDQYAFKTDVMPPLANPMLLSKHRRACVFPIQKAFSRIYVGVFARVDGNAMDRFIGRIVLDVSKLRPGSTYDVTLPLRLSNQIYSRTKRGAIRCRFHLNWFSEKAALMSYVPKSMPRFNAHDTVTVRCSDNKAFQNVARVVHGQDIPGKFSMRLTKATTREINFVRVHVFRYLRKKELRSISQWQYPVISAFAFSAWMHSVYVASLAYVPGHILTLMLLYLWKNYTLLVLDQSYSNGFAPPFVEEIAGALLGESIEPLQMERKNQSDLIGETSDDDSDTQLLTLQDLAKDFQENVPRITRRRAGPNSFLGKDGVTFLVDMNYASSRQEAVELGSRLQNELHLFQSARRRQVNFKDGDVVFEFLNVETPAYLFTTHKPWFCFISRLLFSNDNGAATDAHIEFPFASSSDHPRFTVRDCLPSGETANMLASMQDVDLFDDFAIEEEGSDEEDDDRSSDTTDDDFAEYERPKHTHDESFDSSFADILKSGSGESIGTESILLESSLHPLPRSRAKSADVLLGGSVAPREDVEPELPTGKEIKVLPPPPIQDMDVVPVRDKTLPEVLTGVSLEVHRTFFNLFHDKAYRIRIDSDTDTYTGSDSTKKVSGKSQRGRKAATAIASSLPQSQLPEKEMDSGLSKASQSKMKQDQYDKLLRSGKYSSTNVIVGKLGMVVQPLVEIAQTFVAFFRSAFNIFTWRDPFLTFWVAIAGALLIPLLHFFPWRYVFGIVGVAFVGPQNWALRKFREHTQPPSAENFDFVVRKKRGGDNDGENKGAPVFSSLAQDNRPVRLDPASLVASDIKEVAVPQSNFLYRRCYDWPPEPEYARVLATRPPENNPEAVRLLEADLLDTYGATLLESTSDHNANGTSAASGRKRWARRMVNKGVNRLRSGRKKES
ncbi:MAG: hypothetical protein SGILL_000043, partial [Bacillariaceae sp.]